MSKGNNWNAPKLICSMYYDLKGQLLDLTCMCVMIWTEIAYNWCFFIASNFIHLNRIFFIFSLQFMLLLLLPFLWPKNIRKSKICLARTHNEAFTMIDENKECLKLRKYTSYCSHHEHKEQTFYAFFVSHFIFLWNPP